MASGGLSVPARLPYAAGVFVVAVAFWGGALGCLVSPLWLSYTDHPTTTPGTASFFAAGVVLLFAAPWPVRGAATVSKLLLRRTLDPAADRQRVRQLELARGR